MALQTVLRRSAGAVRVLPQQGMQVSTFSQFPVQRRSFSAPSSEPPAKIVALCDELCTLNVIEMNQLVNLFKAKVGLAGVDIMPQMGGGGGGGGAVAPAAAAAPAAVAAKVEKEFFDVKLVSFDAANKIKVIKEVRAITGLGLKEAKDLVEGVPKDLKKEVNKADAAKIVELLKAVGGVVVLE